MKTNIEFKVSAGLKKHIKEWQSWLLDERRYSLHTLDAYSRDLAEIGRASCRERVCQYV